ncbi:MAG: arylesterase [Alphaproteobacteria bacterium]
MLKIPAFGAFFRRLSGKNHVPDEHGFSRRKINGLLGGIVVATVLGLAPIAKAQEPYKIIALGDSLTAGYGLDRNLAFPAVLERALSQKGYNVQIINAGVSGDTTAGGFRRLSWTLADGADMVLLALGANDGLRGVNPTQTQKNLDAMIGHIKSRNMDMILIGLKAPRSRGRAYQERADAMWPALAYKHQVPLHPDFMKDVLNNPDLKLRDGLHPNKEGVEKMVENFLPVILKHLPDSAKSG